MATFGGVRHAISDEHSDIGSSRSSRLFNPVVLTGVLVSAELLLLTLLSLGAVDAGEAMRYDRTFSPRPVIVAGLLVPVVFVLTRFASRSVMLREVPTVIATVLLGMAAQAFLYGLGRHQVTRTLSSDTFNVTAERYGAFGLLRHYDELAPTLGMHAQANMPGKVMFYALLRQVTTSTQVLAFVVLGLSAFGGVFVYLIAKRLFGSRQAALFGVLLYFFIPARTGYITSLNNVTAVIALLFVALILLYLDKPSLPLTVVFGLLGYGTLLFDPAALLVAPVVLALMVRHAIIESLPVRHVANLAVGSCAAFAGAYVGMRATFGFDIFAAVEQVANDARLFNLRFRPNRADWPGVNLREFGINAGLALSLLVVAVFVDMLVAMTTRRAPLRRALLDPIWLLTGTLVFSTVVFAFAGVNRGEVARLWLFLAAILAMLGGAICAERLPSWVFPVVLSCLVAQIVFGQQFIRFAMVVQTDYFHRVKEMTYDGTYLLDAAVGVFLVVTTVLAVRHHRRTSSDSSEHPSPSFTPPSETDRPTRVRSRRGALAALLLGAAAVVVGAGPASGAGFAVTTTDDGGPGSLRAAVALASASGEPNVIELQDGATYVLDDCAAGALHHTGSQPLTVEGKGSTIRQACAGNRVIETDSDLTVNDLTITGGDLPGGLGGGIEADTDSVTLVRSTVTGNHASTGGGVAAIHVTLVGSTISGNTAGSTGGGVWADQTLAATNSTITGNQAGTAGGGLVVVNTSIGLLHATVVANTAPVGANIQIQPGGDELIAFASVIGTPQGGTSCDLAPGAVTTSQGANFSSDASCGFGEAPDDLDGGGDPKLGPLGANGGSTLTMLPATASPLIDRAECLTGEVAVPTDQRSVTRPQGSRCDTGAVEVEQSSTTTTSAPAPGRPPTARPAVPIAARPNFTG